MKRLLHGEAGRWKRRFLPKLGQTGETEALRFLLNKGYDVVARNFHIANGEIDLIAYDQQTLVFVEVKSRSHQDGFAPQLAVNSGKQEQLVRLAGAFCHRYGLDRCPIRFDIVAITFPPQAPPHLEHFIGAF
ncbi:MAG: YraN family protein [Acidobacteria bacterium]|nr:YraN family protein [Acidobacteriota bacterium]